MSDVARLAIGAARTGIELTNFDELDLTIDMLAPGSPWTFSLWRSDGSPRMENRWQQIQSVCKVGETVRVSIDNAVQLHGAIDAMEVVTDEAQSITISGRDFAARAMDGDADPRLSLRGLMLPDALGRVLEHVWSTPAVIVDGARQAEVQGRPSRERATRTSSRARARTSPDPRTKRVDAFKINVGDKAWAVCDQLCRRSGYLLWCAPHEGTAGLVVDVPVSTGAPLYQFARTQGARGVLGGNILRSRYKLDGGDVPTHVTAFASTRLSENDDAHGRWAVVNTAFRDHPRVAHESTLSSSLIPKPRYIEPRRCSTIEHIEKAAHRCIAEAMADFETLEVTVRGWGQGEGADRHIYAVNTPAHVRDATLTPVLDATWLVTRVAFHRSVARGTLTTLRMVPLGAIEVFPPEAA